MRRGTVWLLVAVAWLAAAFLAGCAVLRSVAPGVTLPQPRLAAGDSGQAAPVPVPAGQTLSAPVANDKGFLRVRIRWPEYRSQLIPSDTNAISLEVKTSGGTQLAYQVFGRPAGASTTTATMSIDAGNNLTVQVYAYRDPPPLPAGSQATAQGSASGVNVIRAQFTDLAITLQSLSAPSIASFSANVGKVGDTFTIFGSNLAPTLPGNDIATPTVVFENGATASTVIPVATGEVQVVVPAGAACGNVLLKQGNQSTENPATFYVTNGVLISTSTESWDPSAAGTTVIPNASTRSFAVNAGFVFPAGSSSVDFPSLPAIKWQQTAGRDVGRMGQDGVFTASASLPAGIVDTKVSAALTPIVSNEITVKVLIISVSVTPTASINVPAPEGQTSAGFASTAQLTGTATNNLGLSLSGLTWTSNDAATATVNATGLVSAASGGIAVVTAKSSVDTRRLATSSIEVKQKGIVDITVD
ncbi:MAG: hypothetical protein FJZ01_21020 [Candidatus Sericytochromatia bacterium]|nr:hypothetical protein [Candidatus Tanganyikabacteria bacterium]